MEASSPKELLEAIFKKLGLNILAIHESLDSGRSLHTFSVFLPEEESQLFHSSLEEIIALERTLRLMLRKAGYEDSVEVDVAGLRALRDEKLRELVRVAAREALRTQKPIALHPMPSRERRVVHLELASHPEVRTESIGEGEFRQVVIYPITT